MNTAHNGFGVNAPNWFGVFRRGWYFVAIFALLGLLVALGLSLLATPMYRASATVYVSSSADESTSASLYQGSLASEQRVGSYTELALSYVVLEEAIRSAGLDLTVAEANDRLSAVAMPDTVLLNVRATDSDPGRAEMLANGVAQALTRYVAQLETPDGQSQSVVRLSVINPAIATDSPVSPQTGRYLIVGFVLGFVLGTLFIFVRARFSDSVRTTSDIAEATGLPVLASIPRDESLGERSLADFSEGWSAVAESYRKLRTNVSFTDVDSDSGVILVTSPVMGEGKTTTALNLAAAFAESGKSVLLVDADLRRPQVSDRLALGTSLGVTNWLRGDSNVVDFIVPSGVPNLAVLASGPRPPNPSELLGSSKLAMGLSDLATAYDYVIIDSPPALPVTDAVVLAKRVSSVVLVARAGVSKRRGLTAALTELSRAHASVVGMVITDVPPTGQYGYSYYGSYSSSLERPQVEMGRR